MVANTTCSFSSSSWPAVVFAWSAGRGELDLKPELNLALNLELKPDRLEVDDAEDGDGGCASVCVGVVGASDALHEGPSSRHGTVFRISAAVLSRMNMLENAITTWVHRRRAEIESCVHHTDVYSYSTLRPAPSILRVCTRTATTNFGHVVDLIYGLWCVVALGGFMHCSTIHSYD